MGKNKIDVLTIDQSISENGKNNSKRLENVEGSFFGKIGRFVRGMFGVTLSMTLEEAEQEYQASSLVLHHSPTVGR